MFGFGKSKTAIEMEELLKRTQLAFENNYKDNATDGLHQMEKLYEKAVENGLFKKKEQEKYEEIIKELEERLKNFDHKQKAQW